MQYEAKYKKISQNKDGVKYSELIDDTVEAENFDEAEQKLKDKHGRIVVMYMSSDDWSE